jgi:RNA polymerase sigma factor (sigma-70 family)
MPANLPPFSADVSPSTSDAELIQQSRNGDEAAYGQMVQRYQSLVCSVAYSRCGDLGMSEDLAQEAFIQAWKKLADLADANKFKSWVCTIARNLASRSREKSTRNVATGAARLDSVAEPASIANNPIQRAISAEQEQLVWQAIADIPENYREPMILFYREEQSVARVAAALEISQDAVKQRLSRGRKFLQEQLAATVESALENSKPSEAFTGAVLVGLASVNAKTATAVAASIAVKTAATSSGIGTGLGAMFLIPFAKLPLIAWLVKVNFDETRSPRERTLMMRFLVFWGLALIPLTALAFGTLPWHSKVQSPVLRVLIFPAIMAVYCIPMIISSYRMAKRIEALRIEENTDAPYGSIVANQEHRGVKTRLFVGSGLLVAVGPVLMLICSADWLGVGLLWVSTLGISLTGARFCGNLPKRSFRVYGASLGCIVFAGLGVLWLRRFVWSDSLSNPSLWFLGATQAMVMTNVVLTMVVWKRVFGKSE